MLNEELTYDKLEIICVLYGCTKLMEGDELKRSMYYLDFYITKILALKKCTSLNKLKSDMFSTNIAYSNTSSYIEIKYNYMLVRFEYFINTTKYSTTHDFLTVLLSNNI